MQISSDTRSIKYSGTYLDNLTSENYDAILSMYKPKLGLFTIGVFHKIIDGFIYDRTANLVKGTEMDPNNFGLPDTYKGFSISYPVNNPEKAIINGLETEIQTNFNSLPFPFKGIVLSGNFTLMDSKAKYQETLFVRTLNPDYGQPGEPRIIFTNHDTAYVDRMLSQAKYLANISVGYDYKGFSARFSYSFTDDILTNEQRRIDGADREAKTAFSKWDAQVKQKITKNLSVYGNIANIFNQPDAGTRLITGYYNYIEYYGMTFNIGLKYKFY
jgi:outer membrane receptor for ferrienterochelin and colicin